MPNLKHNGLKLPSINHNIMYSPNLANLNNAKINKSKGSQIERTYVSNDNLLNLKRRRNKNRHKKRSMGYGKKDNFESNVKLLERKLNKRSLIQEKENHLSNALSIQAMKKLH